jgi:hypothetical protein
MKKLATLAVLLSLTALGGDDYIATVAYTGTSACSSALRPKTKYAVRCTTDCYVRVSSLNSGSGLATTNNVLLAAGKLYDTPTTKDQVYICAIQSAAGGNMLIYTNRGPQE